MTLRVGSSDDGEDGVSRIAGGCRRLSTSVSTSPSFLVTRAHSIHAARACRSSFRVVCRLEGALSLSRSSYVTRACVVSCCMTTSRKAHALVARSTASLEAYNIGDAGTAVYEFFWDEFADWCASRHVAVCVTRSSV